MSGLLEMKETIKNIYAKNEVYIAPILKFALAFLILLIINIRVGYMERINSIIVVLVAALFCSFMPLVVTALISGVFLLLHFYALAPECALVVAVLLLIMFLLYVRFVPKEMLVILLTPFFFMVKAPYVIAIAMGLIGGPASIISVSFGVIVSYLIEYIEMNATTITAMGTETIVARLRFLVDGLLTNKAMLVTVFAFAITILLVYIIRTRSMDHAWTIAIVAGTLTDIFILLVGDLFYDLNYSIIGIVLGSIVAGVLCRFLEFFSFHLDYNRTENVQFEDDEYYYYVKAVPKITVSAPDKKVKKINTKRVTTETSHRTGSHTAKSSNTTSTVRTAHGVTRTTSK